MGLIRSASTAFNSTLADQWKEFFICDSLDSNTIVKKGYKQIREKSSNVKSSEDIISDGSIVVVNEGQAAIIVDNGEILDFIAEVGVYEFDEKGEPSIFKGSFGSGLVDIFKTTARRFTFGGDTARNTKVYYFNIKELYNQKFGTAAPVVYNDPFYQSISIRFFGQAALRLENPITFYKNVCANVEDSFELSEYWENQLQSEFLMNMTQTLSLLAKDNIKYNEIPQQQVSLGKYMNDVLDTEWNEKRGLVIDSVGITSITLSPEDKEKIDKYDDMKVMSDSKNAAGRMTAATASAMESAGENEGGAMFGFAGMNMAMQQGQSQVNELHKMANEEEMASNSWTCSCGTKNSGKFCTECGKENMSLWTCSCGTKNSGKFCTECGKENMSAWTCSCNTKNTGKFCTECGKEKE